MRHSIISSRFTEDCMFKKRVILSFMLLLALMVVPAQADESDDERLNVVVTFSILGDVVERVAGDAADVTVIMPRNADPHVYEPTPQQVIAMTNADIVFSNGMRFEEGIVPLFEADDSINHAIASLCVPVWSFDGHDHDHDDHAHDYNEDRPQDKE
ncbi:MAG: hypothetical protein EA396_07000 [Anaerolineaceae bacterium]|nr:MAG: hypothetical protein EA396_07000 [Anaerolineaceae bacterium]